MSASVLAMTTAALIEAVEAHGCKVEMNCVGPQLRGRTRDLPLALLGELKARREEVIRHLSGAPFREWLWHGGHEYDDRDDGWLSGHPDRHPTGASWWRHAGERAWRLVPRGGWELAWLCPFSAARCVRPPRRLQLARPLPALAALPLGLAVGGAVARETAPAVLGRVPGGGRDLFAGAA